MSNANQSLNNLKEGEMVTTAVAPGLPGVVDLQESEEVTAAQQRAASMEPLDLVATLGTADA